MSTSAMVPITDAARRLGRSPWTLKRLFREGHLPVLIIQDRWLVPESFLAMAAASPQPGRAGKLEDIAAEWFALNSANAVTA